MLRPRFEVAHILSDLWPEIQNDPHFNSHQLRMLNALRICRTSALGGHIDRCDSCDHLRISYNSCRNRHCPKCQGVNRNRWIEAQYEKLLPVKYFHVVFTLPDTLNGLCLAYPKMMYSILFSASWQTIKTFARDKKHLGAHTGMSCILHTWGQNLSLHPHLHCIVPGGGITPSGKWKQARSKGKYLFPVKAMSPVFRAIYVRLLRKQVKEQGIAIPKALFDCLFEKNWVVYAKQPFLGPKQIIEYLGRYTHKVAISNHRLVNIDGNEVRFKYKDYRHGAKVKFMCLNKLEFIRRFSLHILPLRFVRIRHFGILAGRNKEKWPEIFQAVIEPGLEQITPLLNPSFMATKNITGSSCPCCKTGQMITLAFFDCRGPPDLSQFRKDMLTPNQVASI